MKGIPTWKVTGRVWDYDLWYCCAVFLLKSFIPANFFKSWKENASDLRSAASCKVISLSESHGYFSCLLSSSYLLSFHSTLTFGSQGFHRSHLDFAQSPCGFNSTSWKRINAGKSLWSIAPQCPPHIVFAQTPSKSYCRKAWHEKKRYIDISVCQEGLKQRLIMASSLMLFYFFYNAQLHPDESTVTPKVNRESQQNYSEFTWA